MSETSIEIECRICYSEKEKETFVDCQQCKHGICLDCFDNLRTYICPYCRTQYNNSSEPPFSLSLERQNAYSVYHPVYTPIGVIHRVYGNGYFNFREPNIHGPIARPVRRITPELIEEMYNLTTNPTSHFI
jgi:hypothetical protein